MISISDNSKIPSSYSSLVCGAACGAIVRDGGMVDSRLRPTPEILASDFDVSAGVGVLKLEMCVPNWRAGIWIPVDDSIATKTVR